MQVRSLCSKLQNGALAAFFSFLILLIAPSGGVFAEDSNSLRIGGDYQFLTLKEGAGFRECRRACRNDVSCKAWTFIKERVRNRKGLNFNLGPDLNIGFGGKKEIIPAQCRLKHTVGPKHANDCCISGVKRVAARRRGNKAERCATYAESAVEQQDKNLTQRCRYRGTRWSGNYRDHYRWCMDTSTRTSTKETNARDDKLRACRRDRRVRNRRCDRYASTALDILKQARQNDCRNSSSGWEDDHERIYEWCLDHRPAKRSKVLDRAQAKLASCIRRGGGTRIERCETYAEKALTQVERANKNTCRISGSTWSPNYKTHYLACRKSDRREMRQKTQLRSAYIQRCVRRGSQSRVLETGSVEVRQRNARQWHKVRFSKRFKDPVVIMGPVSSNGADPAHARVRSVSPRGFEFRIEEFGKDGSHGRETLSYMVVEKGIHKFEGTVIEASVIRTDANMVNRDWAPVRLSTRWRSAPVVLAQVQTAKGADPVNARIKGVSRRGFEVSLSEQENDRRGHTREQVAFVAITQGRHQIEGEQDAKTSLWSGRVARSTDRWSEVSFPRRFGGGTPALFASAQSSNGADAFDIRYRRLNNRRVQMRLQEEQSKDRETKHANEVLGVVALPFGSYWSTSSSPLDDQVADRPVRPVERDDDDGISIGNCRDYAEKAVTQFRRQRRQSCGFDGSNWHGDASRHRRWCRRNGLSAAGGELQDHQSRLQRCIRRGGANDDVRDREPPRRRFAALDWQRVKGSLKQVSIGSDGVVWGVSSDRKVWERRRGRWIEKRGRLKQVDVGNAGEIWGIGRDDRIYRWDGRRWTQKPGRLAQISVGSDGTVWGTASNGEIYRWSGRWHRVKGGLKQVSVGNSKHIWGVNRNNEVYRWSGRNWQRMDGSMKAVAVGSDGTVYGLSSNGRVHRWGARRNSWVRLKGTLTQISSGDGSKLWGVNARKRIFKTNVR